MSHQAEAIVLSCIDFRFREAVHDFLQKDLGLHDYDHKTDGGGVKQLVEEGPIRDWILKNFEIAFNLHGVERIILINHQDCGAYGGSAVFGKSEDEISFHKEQLKQAISFLSSEYPDKQIEGYFALLEDVIKFEKVS